MPTGETLSPYEDELQLNIPQQEALAAMETARSAGINSGYLNMATGLGKTRAMAHDAARLLEEDPSANILYLCHRTGILEQAEQTFKGVLGNDVPMASIYGGSLNDRGQVTFASFSQMNVPISPDKKIYELIPKKHFGRVYVDENHHGPAPTYRPVIEYFKPDTLVGATATPLRRDQRDIEEIFGKEYYRKNLEDAIVEGHLVRPEYHLMTDHVRRMKEIRTDLGRVSLSQLNSLIFIPKRDEEIVATIEKFEAEEEDSRTIIFANNINHAEHIAALKGGAVATYHSKLPKEIQDNNLEAFKSGAIDTLVAVDKLNEGIDIPEVNLVVFLRSTESRTVFLQQLGRGLRRIPGKDKVTVLDFAATWERIRDVKDLQDSIEEADQRNINSSMQAEASYKFQFSDETLNAIEVIEYARNARLRPKAQKIGKRATQLMLAENFLQARLPKHMSRADSERLIKKVVSGDIEARNEFVSRYVGTVYETAKYRAGKDEGLLVEDLFQDSVVSLIEKLKDYNSRSYRLPKIYASAVVNRSMDNDSRKYTPVVGYLTDSVLNDLEKLSGIYNELSHGKLDNPSDSEVAKIWLSRNNLSIRRDEATARIKTLIGLRKTLAEAHNVMHEARNLTDGGTDPVFEEVSRREQRGHIMNVLEDLPYRERRILELLYGVVHGEETGVKVVARTFNVTTGRIRQLQEDALKKLNSSAIVHRTLSPESERIGGRIAQTEKQKYDRAFADHINLRQLSPSERKSRSTVASYHRRQLSPEREAILNRIQKPNWLDENIHHYDRVPTLLGNMIQNIFRMNIDPKIEHMGKLVTEKGLVERRSLPAEVLHARVVGALKHTPGRLFNVEEFNTAISRLTFREQLDYHTYLDADTGKLMVVYHAKTKAR